MPAAPRTDPYEPTWALRLYLEYLTANPLLRQTLDEGYWLEA